MKNRLAFILLAVVLLSACVFVSIKNSGIYGFSIDDTVKDITNRIFEDGCIRDEDSAKEIAALILKGVYGEDFDNGLPLSVSYDDDIQAWEINTQLPDGYLGGAKHIVLKKSNAEVIAIWATK